MGAHAHVLTAVQTIFTKAGYRTDRKNVQHSRGLKKADLVIKDFQLTGVRNVIRVLAPRIPGHAQGVLAPRIPCSCADPQRNGEASHADVNGALDAAVKEKLDNYQYDYNAR